MLLLSAAALETVGCCEDLGSQALAPVCEFALCSSAADRESPSDDPMSLISKESRMISRHDSVLELGGLETMTRSDSDASKGMVPSQDTYTFYGRLRESQLTSQRPYFAAILLIAAVSRLPL